MRWAFGVFKVSAAFLTDFLLMLPRPLKRALALGADAFVCGITVWMAFNLRLESWTAWSPAHFTAFVGAVAFALPLFIVFGLYRAIFRYAGLPAFMTVFKAAALYAVLYCFAFTVVGVPGVPRTVGVLQPLLLLLGVTLSRSFVRYWLGGIYQSIVGKEDQPRVLIYGAGSAGRQLAAALKTSPELVVVDVQLVPLLANVRDAARMDEILRTWKPHTVYHAAAYKHVPLVEHNPAEGVKNNVLGTLNTAQLAAVHRVSDFVLISTDKAVRPTNVMGASKRLAEMVLQAQAAVLQGQVQGQGCKTRFSMVRFGNVLGSSGSVVPLFRKQIKDGGPITLTDERITRYFMTISEAAQLVIQAGAMASGGDVFVLDMGEPVKIIDLAKRMVELSGLALKDEVNPNGDIAIAVTGLRPGEKLYEELLIGENPLPTSHPRIMKAHEDFLPWDELQAKLGGLRLALDANDVPLIRSLLKDLVPGYQPDGEVVDWVWMENAKAA